MPSARVMELPTGLKEGIGRRFTAMARVAFKGSIAFPTKLSKNAALYAIFEIQISYMSPSQAVPLLRRDDATSRCGLPGCL